MKVMLTTILFFLAVSSVWAGQVVIHCRPGEKISAHWADHPNAVFVYDGYDYYNGYGGYDGGYYDGYDVSEVSENTEVNFRAEPTIKIMKINGKTIGVNGQRVVFKQGPNLGAKMLDVIRDLGLGAMIFLH